LGCQHGNDAMARQPCTDIQVQIMIPERGITKGKAPAYRSQSGRAQAEQPVSITDQQVAYAVTQVLCAAVGNEANECFQFRRLLKALDQAVEQIDEKRLAVGAPPRPGIRRRLA